MNHFPAAGGMGFRIAQLLQAGLLHADVNTILGHGLQRFAVEPWLDNGQLAWRAVPEQSADDSVLRPVASPFSADGGLKRLRGNLGRAVVKTSAVKPEHRLVHAPAVVVESQQALSELYKQGALERDFVAVVRFQGPQANGMPELHKLTPLLANLQDRGQRVAIVTDGRMSGASGKVPAAIHVTPEAALGGPLARIHDGDLITVDAERGILSTAVSDAELDRRPPVGRPPLGDEWTGTGRELFSAFRAVVGTADTGASVFMDDPDHHPEVRRVQHA